MKHATVKQNTFSYKLGINNVFCLPW